MIRRLLIAFLAIALAGAASVSFADEPNYLTKFGLVYAERNDEKLAADVYIPKVEGPHPGVLVVHGGAWAGGTREQLGHFARQLATHGYTAVAISYRLAPKHLFPAQLEDCQDAVRWMRRKADDLQIDPQHIGGFGYSAGGHLVTLLGAMSSEALEQKNGAAADPDAVLQCVVAGGAPCDFRLLPPNNRMLAYWLGGSRAEKPEQYTLASPANFVSRRDPPMFFYHGEKDALVPLISPMAMDVLLKLSGVPSQVHTVAGAGHVAAIRDEAAMKSALQFLNLHLKGEALPAPQEKP